jgi:phosphohistidine phosphatase
MRHAEALFHRGHDAERALSVQGLEQARQAGAWLGKNVPAMAVVCYSPYLRARQTADELCRFLESPRQIQLGALVPEAQPAALLRELEALASDTLLCVSHQPLVGNVRNLLVEGAVGSGYAFSPAAVALIECEFLAPGGGRMQWLRSPGEFQ